MMISAAKNVKTMDFDMPSYGSLADPNAKILVGEVEIVEEEMPEKPVKAVKVKAVKAVVKPAEKTTKIASVERKERVDVKRPEPKLKKNVEKKEKIVEKKTESPILKVVNKEPEDIKNLQGKSKIAKRYQKEENAEESKSGKTEMYSKTIDMELPSYSDTTKATERSMFSL